MRVACPSRGRPEILGNPQELTGFPGGNGPHVMGPGTALERPPRPAWISDALLAETVEVWSEAYGRPIGEEEAIEILTNVKRLGEALLDAKREAMRK